MRPMSHQQKCYVLQHHCFLLRNLEKVRRIRDRITQHPHHFQHLNHPASISNGPSSAMNSGNASMTTGHTAAFLSQLNALRQPRNMRTRRLAQAEEDPELNKTARLATVLRDLLVEVKQGKDECGEALCAQFLILPAKRKMPEYYAKITEPIDLNTVEQNVDTGVYKTAESFDADMNR